MEDIKKSPPPKIDLTKSDTVISEKKKLVDFAGAVSFMLEGKRVTRAEWNDIRWYCLLKDDILCIHKAGESGETVRPWTISNGDLAGEDWYEL